MVSWALRCWWHTSRPPAHSPAQTVFLLFITQIQTSLLLDLYVVDWINIWISIPYGRNPLNSQNATDIECRTPFYMLFRNVFQFQQQKNCEFHGIGDYRMENLTDNATLWTKIRRFIRLTYGYYSKHYLQLITTNFPQVPKKNHPRLVINWTTQQFRDTDI